MLTGQEKISTYTKIRSCHADGEEHMWRGNLLDVPREGDTLTLRNDQGTANDPIYRVTHVHWLIGEPSWNAACAIVTVQFSEFAS